MYFCFEKDISIAQAELNKNIAGWYFYPLQAQEALTNMCFNLGINRLLSFKNMLGALQTNNYEKAASEALNSKWARQVGVRSKRIAAKIRSCI